VRRRRRRRRRRRQQQITIKYRLNMNWRAARIGQFKSCYKKIGHPQKNKRERRKEDDAKPS